MGKKFCTVVLIAILAGAGIYSCGSGGGSTPTTGCGTSTQGCVSGNVKDTSAGAVSGAIVKVSGTTVATANAQGWFSATGIDQGNPVVCFEGSNMATKCRTVSITGGSTTPLTSTVLPLLGTKVTIPAIEAAYATAQDTATAAAVVFPSANSVCDANGTVVTGSADCYFTPVDVTTESGLEGAPNSFEALNASNVRGTLVSSAMMNLTCVQGTNVLNLCSGQTATVRVPIYSGCTTEPTSIDGWRFNESTGLWSLYDGSFSRTCGGTPDETNSYYQGTIDHMSWINGDRYVADACLTGQVYASASQLTTEPVTVTCWGAGWHNETQVDPATGKYYVPVPINYSYTCKVGDSTRAIAVSDYITGTAPATATTFPVTDPTNCATLSNITFANPLVTTTLTWGDAYPASSDLDSHFVSQGGGTHIYFIDKNLTKGILKGSLTASPWISLDTDDTDYSGPEITTVLPQAAAGTYRFCVVNYVGEAGGAFYSSAAKVRVNIPNAGSGSISAVDTELSAPTSGTTTDYVTWQVYEVVISGGVVTDYTELNTMTSGDDVGSGCWN